MYSSVLSHIKIISFELLRVFYCAEIAVSFRIDHDNTKIIQH